MKEIYNFKGKNPLIRNQNENVSGDENFDAEIQSDTTVNSVVSNHFDTQSRNIMLERTHSEIDDRQYSKLQLMDLPIDVKKYYDLTLFWRVMKLLTPFEIMYRKVWVTEAFVYPQMFMTCITICYFSLAYFTYETIKFIFSINDKINNAYDQVYTSAYSFLRTGMEKYFMMFKYEPSTEELQSYYSKLDSLQTIVNQLTFAIIIGSTIGMCVAFTIVSLNTLWIVHDFRQRVLDARKGVCKFNRKATLISLNLGVAGAIISNSMFL